MTPYVSSFLTSWNQYYYCDSRNSHRKRITKSVSLIVGSKRRFLLLSTLIPVAVRTFGLVLLCPTVGVIPISAFESGGGFGHGVLIHTTTSHRYLRNSKTNGQRTRSLRQSQQLHPRRLLQQTQVPQQHQHQQRLQSTMAYSSSSSDDNTVVMGSVLQIYPLECYEELLKEQQEHNQQQKQPSSSSSSIETIHRIHIVRHAEGTHNVNKEYKDRRHRDAPLTEKGFKQCENLAEHIRNTKDTLFPTVTTTTVNDDDDDNDWSHLLVVTSPLTRCVQTAIHSFPEWVATDPTIIPFVAHEGIRETVNYECDVRRSIATIAAQFPRIDFRHCSSSSPNDEEDPIWRAYRQRLGETYDSHCESAELHVVARRGHNFFQWLVQEYGTRNPLTNYQHKTDIIICTHSAFLRCILNWEQVGGVPQQMAQTLSKDRNNDDKHPPALFEYCTGSSSSSRTTDDDIPTVSAFEASMRHDYNNCELRSFCLVRRQR